MEIKWVGHACFKLQGKEVSVVTDPFGAEVGFAMPKLSGNILTISHDHFDHNNRDAVTSDIVFDAPGEFEFKGVRVIGVRTFHDEERGAKRGDNLMFLFMIDGLKLLHCGDLGHMPSDNILDSLGDVDVLFLPAGGNYTLPVSQAVELVHRLEPKVVVPMHFHIPGLKLDVALVDGFLKQLGFDSERVSSFVINKNNLPEEGVKVYVLQPAVTKAAV